MTYFEKLFKKSVKWHHWNFLRNAIENNLILLNKLRKSFKQSKQLGLDEILKNQTFSGFNLGYTL